MILRIISGMDSVFENGKMINFLCIIFNCRVHEISPTYYVALCTVLARLSLIKLISIIEVIIMSGIGVIR